MRYYTTSQLSKNRKVTPEGYLVCLDVPVARTGTLEYAPSELPDDFGDDAGSVLVSRSPADVFDQVSIASYEGKPVTVGHPEDDVVPDNWRELACGHAQNVRPGRDREADLLLADLLITDR